MDITERRELLRRKVAELRQAGFQFQSEELRQKARVAVRLSMADYIPDNDTRRRVLGWIFVGIGELSSSQLTDEMLHALKLWLQILPTGGPGEWSISDIAAGELRHMAALVDGKLDNPALPGLEPGGMAEAAIKAGGVLAPENGPQEQPKQEPEHHLFIYRSPKYNYRNYLASKIGETVQLLEGPWRDEWRVDQAKKNWTWDGEKYVKVQEPETKQEEKTNGPAYYTFD